VTNNWKQLAWNGIRFETPAQWEVVQIGIRHLILENEVGPVMEVKWGAVKGTFSHRTHLKRLASLQSRRNKISVAEWILPPPWEAALADFEAGGFLWQSPAASGRGAILFCSGCRTATLIQFFGDSSVKREKEFLAVLRSFRDHSRDGWLPWSISVDDCEAAEWEIKPGSDWLQKLGRFKITSSFFFFRLWHLEEQNRILGVRVESKHPIDLQLVRQIYEHYKSL
jgi:hypothetical protein